MKKILLLLTIFCSFISMSQTQFDYLGGMVVDANSTGCFYVDLNTYGTNTGINDVKFVHGDGNIYFEALYSDSANIIGRDINGETFWRDCENDLTFEFEKVYLIKGSDNLGSGRHVLPFMHSGRLHFFVISINSDKMIIHGWVFNILKSDFECYVHEETASITELNPENQTFVDYNYLGQPINEFHTGLVIRRYTNGFTKTIYK